MDEASRARDALLTLGIDRRAATVYQELRARGPASAAALARRASLRRAEGYRALDVLVRRGFVAVCASDPARFEALDVTDAFAIAADEEESRVAAIVGARDAFLEAIEPGRHPDERDNAAWSFRPIVGARAFSLTGRRMVRRARETILVSCGPRGPPRDDRATDQMLLAAAQRRAQGVELRVVAPARVPLEGARIFRNPPRESFLVVDGEECAFLSWDEVQGARGGRGTWTDAAALVGVAQILHAERWNDAEGTPP